MRQVIKVKLKRLTHLEIFYGYDGARLVVLEGIPTKNELLEGGAATKLRR